MEKNNDMGKSFSSPKSEGKATWMKNAILIILTAILLTSISAFAEQKGKIAVAADGQTSESLVSTQAGRAPFFLVFDENGKLIEAIANPAREAQNSGIAVADFLAGKGVAIVVAGEYGPQIVGVMKGKGIKAVSFKGSVAEAVKKVLESK